MKPKNQDTILVRIPKPETNVDWNKYVDTQPGWAKRLESTLSSGATEVTFRARSPHSNVFDVCRVIINVIGKQNNKLELDTQMGKIINYLFVCLRIPRSFSAQRDLLPGAICCESQSRRGESSNLLEGSRIREQTTGEASVQVKSSRTHVRCWQSSSHVRGLNRGRIVSQMQL